MNDPYRTKALGLLNQLRVDPERLWWLTVALATALLLLLTSGAGGMGLWHSPEQVQEKKLQAYLNKEVAAALDEAERSQKELHRRLAGLQGNLDEWQKLLSEARCAWQCAQTLAGVSPKLLEKQTQSRLEALGRRLSEDVKNLALIKELDAIRLKAATLNEGKLNPADASPRYEAMFLKVGLDLKGGDKLKLVDQVKQSPMRLALVAALDHWATVTDDRKLRPRLLEVARRADPDPWRDQLRDEQTWTNVKKLRELAANVQPRQQTPQILSLLASRLHIQGSREEAVALLRRALLHYPSDFWLNFDLGNITADSGERAGFYRAALALQPNNTAAYINLGIALQAQQDLAGAVACYRKAIELDPRLTQAYLGLGNALHAMKDLAGAIATFQKAIALDPKLAVAHYNLGNALREQKNLAGAVAAYKSALVLDPTFIPAYFGLARVLHEQKDLPGAIAFYRKAIELDPRNAQAYLGLGNALRNQHKLDEAIASYKRAIALDPKNSQAHFRLGNVLHEQRDLVGAVKAYQTVLELDPKFHLVHYSLGLVFYDLKDLTRAAASYRAEIATNPNYAPAHCNLGHILRQQGKFAEAATALRRGHELGAKQPGWNYPSAQWVRQCEQLLALDQMLPEVLAGKVQPKDAAEQLALADLCRQYKQQYAAANRFYAAAFAAEPKLAGNLNNHRYNAACVAALAGANKGKDADKLSQQDRALLRRQALDWLNADLKLWQRQAQSDQPKDIQVLKRTLSHWLTDPDLAQLREEKALAKLPREEQAAWQKLWSEVKQLSQDAKTR